MMNYLTLIDFMNSGTNQVTTNSTENTVSSINPNVQPPINTLNTSQPIPTPTLSSQHIPTPTLSSDNVPILRRKTRSLHTPNYLKQYNYNLPKLHSSLDTSSLPHSLTHLIFIQS